MLDFGWICWCVCSDSLFWLGDTGDCVLFMGIVLLFVMDEDTGDLGNTIFELFNFFNLRASLLVL